MICNKQNHLLRRNSPRVGIPSGFVHSFVPFSMYGWSWPWSFRASWPGPGKRQGQYERPQVWAGFCFWPICIHKYARAFARTRITRIYLFPLGNGCWLYAKWFAMLDFFFFMALVPRLMCTIRGPHGFVKRGRKWRFVRLWRSRWRREAQVGMYEWICWGKTNQ